ncbi:MAG: hypothetical protein JXB04_10780 [Kiritimatiellae bacterium]|nr:hypothetical protein [Kiritimatiellia bacterium]
MSQWVQKTLITAALAIGLAVPYPATAAEPAAAFQPFDLSPAYNADIFTRFECRTDGAVDSGRSSFPAEMMPESGLAFRTAGVEFRFPSRADGDLNAVRCEGQTVAAPGVAADYLYLLATAADGNQREKLILTHEDGSAFETAFDVNDWCAENPGLGGVHGLVSDYRHTLGGKQDCKTSIWMIPLKLRSTSPLVSIGLPKNPNVFVVAAALGPAGRERRVGTYVKDAFLPSAEAGIDRLVLLDIVEPSTNATLRLLSHDNRTLERNEMANFDLKSGTQSIPAWLPIEKRRTYFFEIAGEEMASLDETNLFANAPTAILRVHATHPAHPADADLGMAPAWQIPALPGSDLAVGIHVPDSPASGMLLRATVTSCGSADVCRSYEREIALPSGAPVTTSAAIDLDELAPGNYNVALSLLLNGLPYAQQNCLLTIVDPRLADRPFGAREAALDYQGPVWTNWDAAISYEEAWRGFTHSDIVIDFPGQPYRYVFWKGAGYCPVWLFDHSFVSLEWMEAWPRQDGAVDCVEPLQDKECKHSRVELLSTTAARARVKWTYAETDFELKVIHGEHAEEIYTIYPDGIGARKVTGHFEKGRWHEVQEFITGSAAGTIPSEHYPPQAASLINCAGDRLDLYWPTPQESDLPVWSEYIGLAHSKRHPSVFAACAGRDTGLHVFSNNPDWLPEVFFCMPHWPIQRGLPTTNARSIEECKNRATHASLLNIYAAPHELYKDRTVWALLIGIAPADEQELRDLVRGWLYPAGIEVTSVKPLKARYDIYQRGYVVDLAGEKACNLRIRTSAEHPQVRPAFVLRNAGGHGACAVTLNGKDLVEGTDFETGLEDNSATRVVWLRTTLRESAELAFALQ